MSYAFFDNSQFEYTFSDLEANHISDAGMEKICKGDW